MGARAPMQAVPEQQLLPQGPISKWSDVAKYSKALELQEEANKLQTKRSHQQQMARDLHVQMAMKKEDQKASKYEDQRLFEHQEVELERWKADQFAQQNEVRRRAIEVEKDRAVQKAEGHRRREEEQQQKAFEESQLVDRAAREMNQERQMYAERKAFSKQRQMQLLQGVQEKQTRTEDERKVQVEEERRKVEEYRQMLEEQEVRNKQRIPPIRGVDAVVKGPPGGRKGDDFYTEENVMKQLHAATELADSTEKDKIRNLKEQKLNNQDYLFQQIAERNKNRDKALDQKRSQKLQAQADTNEYLENERRRIEASKTKNIQYRLDLERQIASNKAALKPRGAEDQMSPHEKAINQHLIQEAEELRQQLNN